MFTAVTSQRSSGGISFMYALHARRLSGASKLDGKIAAINELIKKLRAKRPSYSEFEVNFLEIRYSRKLTRQKKLVQYVLAKMDRALNHKGIAIDYSQMTIEHVAPESASHATQQLPHASVASIGNLVIVDQDLNEKLANKPFAQKKAALINSAIWIDDNLKAAAVWSKKEISQRAKRLAKMAYNKVWNF